MKYKAGDVFLFNDDLHVVENIVLGFLDNDRYITIYNENLHVSGYFAQSEVFLSTAECSWVDNNEEITYIGEL
jgi:hypothetical protein